MWRGECCGRFRLPVVAISGAGPKVSVACKGVYQVPSSAVIHSRNTFLGRESRGTRPTVAQAFLEFNRSELAVAAGMMLDVGNRLSQALDESFEGRAASWWLCSGTVAPNSTMHLLP